MAKELASLDQTILILEKLGSDDNEKNLATLYRKLRETRSLRLFQVRARQITTRLQCSLCHMNYCYSHWVVICAVLVECFLRHLDDSDTVAEVLKCVENHFDAQNFFVFTETTFLKMKLSTKVMEERKSKGLRSFCFLSYYLHHANESRLKFRGERFISLTGLIRPCYSIFHTAKAIPHSILTLLQYGGRLADKRRICSSYIPDIMVKALHEIIEYGSEYQQWERNTLSFLVKPSQVNSTVKNMCVCFHALLKDTMNPHEVTFLLAGRVIDGFRIPNQEILVPFYSKLFPDCSYGKRSPSSLRHMSRYVIRRLLYDNWEIPNGIVRLPIPDIIRDYVNLQYD